MKWNKVKGVEPREHYWCNVDDAGVLVAEIGRDNETSTTWKFALHSFRAEAGDPHAFECECALCPTLDDALSFAISSELERFIRNRLCDLRYAVVAA